MLKGLIIKLIEKVNRQAVSEVLAQVVDTWLEENDLTDKSKIPQWFIDMLLCATEQLSCEKTYFHISKAEGDVFNLLAELETVLVADWDDYGEEITISFSGLGVTVYISLEGNFYKVDRFISL